MTGNKAKDLYRSFSDGSTSAHLLVARLKRDYPEIAERLAAGEFHQRDRLAGPPHSALRAGIGTPDHVRYLGQLGEHILTESFTVFDPKPTL